MLFADLDVKGWVTVITAISVGVINVVVTVGGVIVAWRNGRDAVTAATVAGQKVDGVALKQEQAVGQTSEKLEQIHLLVNSGLDHQKAIVAALTKQLEHAGIKPDQHE